MEKGNFFSLILALIGLVADIMGIYSFTVHSNPNEPFSYCLGLMILIYSSFVIAWFTTLFSEKRKLKFKSKSIGVKGGVLGTMTLTLPVHIALVVVGHSGPEVIMISVAISLFHAIIGFGIYIAISNLLPYYYEGMNHLHIEINNFFDSFF